MLATGHLFLQANMKVPSIVYSRLFSSWLSYCNILELTTALGVSSKETNVMLGAILIFNYARVLHRPLPTLCLCATQTITHSLIMIYSNH
jgi:hypothetical protein